MKLNRAIAKEKKEPRPVKQEIFKVSQVAPRLGRSSDWLWQMIRLGKVRTVPMGPSLGITAAEFKRIITEGI